MNKQMAPTLGRGAVSAQSLTSTADKSPLLYGVGILAINIILESFSAYAYFFYIEILGLAMTMAAVVRMVNTIWNSINDPIFAFLSDNTRSRWGRRHAWLVPGMLLTSIVYVLIFFVPNSMRGTTSLFWYMLVILLLFETFATILIVNYVALFPEYFHGLKQRSNASVYYQAGKIIAVFIGLTLTPLVCRLIGFTGTAIAYGILSAGLLTLALIGNREDVQLQAADKVEVLPAVKNVLKDASFWKFGITITVVLFGVNMLPFTLPFYVKHALSAPPELASMLSGAALVASLLALPLWGRLVKQWKMKTTFLLVMLTLSLGTIMISLPPHRLIAFSAIIIIGVAWGGIWICNNVIRADLISQNLASTEKHTEALYYALLNVIQNMSGVLQSVAMILASRLFGYVSGENPGPQPGMAFRFLMGFVPLVGLAISWFTAHSFFMDYSDNVPA
jgi:glycoside/pentoside/hexuronide:cation symporter, GPH family